MAVEVLSTCLLLLCGIIHFRSHFIININCNKYQFIKPIQDSLAFYPSLWTLYILFLFLLSLTIVFTKYFYNNTNNNNQVIISFICYGIIISSCWESLFSFHRYFTLKH